MENKMTRAFLVLALTVLAAGSVSAQAWYNSYAPALANNKILVNAGLGLGPTGGYKRGVPPISVIADFKLPVNLPITVGGIATLSTWKYSTGIPPLYSVDVTYTNFGIGARGMYHFNFLEKLDAYGGLTIGWVMQNSTVKTSGISSGSDSSYNGAPFFLYGFSTGARYFFTDFIGAYFELGYSGLQYMNFGVTLKF
jgi:hypothetical protein